LSPEQALVVVSVPETVPLPEAAGQDATAQ
jgi:cyclic beta-1,2-glucan synthetase